MTRTQALLMAVLAMLAATAPALALNPQPLPPMPRCVDMPGCSARTIPAWTSAPVQHAHRGHR